MSSRYEVDGRIRWTASNMPLLAAIGEDFERSLPFSGLRIGVSLHLEAKTAVLLETLDRGGADLVAAGNYGTSQDDVVDYLIRRGIDARGSRFDDLETHLGIVASVAHSSPDLLLDNGADLVALSIDRSEEILGGTEETTSGHNRLITEYGERVVFPVIVINDSPLKAIAENKHAVGQSVYESLLRLTNLMPHGKRIVVVGYGWCGRGIAHYARANGAMVAVAEVDEIKQLEAFLDGFQVRSLVQLAAEADIVITATGSERVVGADIFEVLSPGALLANAGHFPTEIDVPTLEEITVDREPMTDVIVRHHFADGRFVDLVADGRMINLAGRGAKGNSVESMDLGFALQARSLERVATRGDQLAPGPQPVPDDINRALAVAFIEAHSDDSRAG